ncbi:hypothetical protein I4U23_003336 [Adineta vaga]|nr:hypothetical protein I4U23_003336 [Adineta vaga]
MILIYIIFALHSFLSIDAIDLKSCAKWNTTGVTIIGSNSPGNASHQLNQPQGMFLHAATNSLYVVDTGNNRIQMFLLDQPSTTGSTVIANLGSMYAVYVDDDMTMYIARRFENRVEKWIKGTSRGEQVGDQCKQCRDVKMDREKNIYMIESGTHTLRKWSTKTNTSTRVAGRTDELGRTIERLYFPANFYLNSESNVLYITDTMNNRIQKWNLSSSEGITVAGANDGHSGNDASTLANPLYVWVDETTNIIYIVDTDNDRIQRWLPNQSVGTTIIGEAGRGNANNQLKRPTALTFDKLGNLYVCDSKNHRIQLFALIDNQACIINHSHSLFVKTTIVINLTGFLVISWIFRNL